MSKMADATPLQNKNWEDIYFRGYDGIRLYARHYPGDRSLRPLLCLSDVTQNGRSFEPLATALSSETLGQRPVYTLDYRGRGFSENDPNWKNYTPMIEMLDVINLMALRRIHKPTILASGWGGVIAMTLATLHSSMLGPVILNDTGPKLETNGLLRVHAFIGRVPTPSSWLKAADLIKDLNINHFTDLNSEDWRRLAQQQYNEKDGRPAPSYDPELEKTLMMADVTVGAPVMWEQFAAMNHVPILVIRGENSDVLSKETFEEMFYRHPNLQLFTVANEGHTPLLDDDLSIERIRLFLERCDHLDLDHEQLTETHEEAV
jgi:pimeloyl-ACP methyl ester carboxylesterase